MTAKSLLRSAVSLSRRDHVFQGRKVGLTNLSWQPLLRQRQFCSAVAETTTKTAETTKQAKAPARSSFGGRVRAFTAGLFLATSASAGALVSQVNWSFDELFLAAHDMTRRLVTVEHRIKALEGKA
mmetsp:Transcript_48166/g.108203  ORF Transcript_48166/g.108203 Transcript_48166/m.108203 type:complete len:126 (-) Transcript_48166:69-446(-)